MGLGRLFQGTHLPHLALRPPPLFPGSPGHPPAHRWRDILHMVDIVCCCAILFPIVWSIKQLRDGAETDGKAARVLAKLTLFRQFYIMVGGRGQFCPHSCPSFWFPCSPGKQSTSISCMTVARLQWLGGFGQMAGPWLALALLLTWPCSPWPPLAQVVSSIHFTHSHPCTTPSPSPRRW